MMEKKNLFRTSMLAGVMLCALSLGACSLTADEDYWDENDIWAEEQQKSGTSGVREEVMLTDAIVPVEMDLSQPELTVEAGCTAEDDSCAASDDYLTDQFTRARASDDVVSLSRPAGQKAVSVRDKQKGLTQQSTVAKKSATVSGDKVLYTTQAIPEAVVSTTETVGGVRTTETVTTTVSVSPSNDFVTEDKSALLTTQGNRVDENAEEDENVAKSEMTSETANMIPVKKIKTTITETTTKVKKEAPAPKDFSKMTLTERIEYGEAVQDWDAESGNTLRGLLMDWGKKSGWTVVWKLDRDYHLEAGVVFKGTFTEVSSALIRSFARATPAPIGTFYQGNRVLVVSTQEDENER